ncbi:S8 family peptidase [Bdellovibrio bacteriovorus]|uniref:S8 family peptidase n=1 Tax=Bdellovibrio bacteriovorus TaxID=959 RepID=UPI003AA987B7
MNKNFFLGRGERLTSKIDSIQKPNNKVHPYTFEEAVARLRPQLSDTTQKINALDPSLCPKDEAVFKVILHPAYTARSYYPATLFKNNGLRVVGSKVVNLKPSVDKRKKAPEIDTALNFYVAGKRESVSKLLQSLTNVNTDQPPAWAEDFRKIESISYFDPKERIKNIDVQDTSEIVFEIVVHASGSKDDKPVLDSFIAYLKSNGVQVDPSKIIYAQGLSFITARGSRSKASQVEKHSFLRVMREMPRLRELSSANMRNFSGATPFKITLPTEAALSSEVKVAIFDGGLSKKSPLSKWAKSYEHFPDLTDSVEDGIEHGESVTSAFLFGPIEKNTPMKVPYANVDHYRVIDTQTDANSDLPEVLRRIVSTIEKEKYEFVNLSVGPFLSVDDYEVHVWTATLDELLSDGKTFCSVAVGNTGHLDKLSRANRIQVPGDAVNVMSVGSCNTNMPKKWERAIYSSVGPGRSPGLIKPDLAAFGGSGDNPFYVVNQNESQSFPTQGTSFASPYVLRQAVGIKAHFKKLEPNTIKCLLIHHTEKKTKKHDFSGYGWGKMTENLEDFYLCPDDSVTVIYQGELEPSKFIKAKLPIIPQVKGKVKVKATFAYTSISNAQHANNYTSSGLEVVFRPHSQTFTPLDDGTTPHLPDSDSFFGKKKGYKTESDRRRDSFKWETVLHAERNLSADDLLEPSFDIHYITRDGVTKGNNKELLRYSLIITVQAEEVPDLYNKSVQFYQNELEIFAPEIENVIESQIEQDDKEKS